ncbi:MAG: hypothetical protein PSV35_03540, partial [bacterium]|nr:hypothetical protein [bacterium]
MKKFISILLFLSAHQVLSQSVGTVLFTAQKVIANNNGVERVLTRGAALNTGDAIITAADASAKIRYL